MQYWEAYGVYHVRIPSHDSCNDPHGVLASVKLIQGGKTFHPNGEGNVSGPVTLP